VDIDLSFKNKKKPTEGSILISDPFLDEDFFRRSIVLLCSHSDEEGSIGLVLNNYLEIDLHEVEHTFPDIQARISIGGPVDTEHLFFIHSFGDAVNGATKISGNLFFGGDFEELKYRTQRGSSFLFRILWMVTRTISR
jgi:putative transcriptional regulator